MAREMRRMQPRLAKNNSGELKENTGMDRKRKPGTSSHNTVYFSFSVISQEIGWEERLWNVWPSLCRVERETLTHSVNTVSGLCHFTVVNNMIIQTKSCSLCYRIAQSANWRCQPSTASVNFDAVSFLRKCLWVLGFLTAICRRYHRAAVR